MKEEIRNIVDLSDHGVDLSVYHPEKALHLEWKDVTKEPLEKIAELSARIEMIERVQGNRKLALIRQRLSEKYADRKAFAKAVFAHFPERKDFGTFCRKIVYPFLDAKMTNQSEYKVMRELLELPAEPVEPFELVYLKQMRGLIQRLMDPLDLFVSHFPLLWRNREGICNTPELASSLPGRFGFFRGCSHHATLGEILYLYNDGKLRYGLDCPNCNTELLLYRTGGLMSGKGSSSGFCPNCGYRKYDDHGVNSRGRAFLNHSFSCPKVETKWTMVDLIASLKNYESGV